VWLTPEFFSTAPLSISSSCEQATKVYQHHTYILFVRQEIAALQAKQVPRERRTKGGKKCTQHAAAGVF